MSSRPEGTLAPFGSMPPQANVVNAVGDPFHAFYNAAGAVLGLISGDLGAFLWYADTGSRTQGILLGYIASRAGVDPFGNSFNQGTSFVGSTGMSNPMTTAGDIIYGGSSGTPSRLGIGSGTQVLGIAAGLPAWVASFVSPMVASGDIIVGGAAGAPARLAKGADGTFLTLASGTPVWAAITAMLNPMTTSGDIIYGGSSGVPQRLAKSTDGKILTLVSGLPAWETAVSAATPLAGPSAAHTTVWQLFDGTIVVLPLSTYGLTGDDGHWINQAFTYLPTISGGSGQYGGSYNGPWMVGTIYLPASDYNLATGIVAPVNEGATVNIIGTGPGTRLLCQNGVVGLTSHCAMGGPQAGAPAQQTMGQYWGLRFDGSAGGLVGLEVGGGWGRHIDVACVNFNASTSCIGLHLVNANNAVAGEWTEKSRISCDLMQNANACIIENSNTGGTQASAADSMEYNDIDLYIIATNSAVVPSTGLTIQGGVFLAGGSLRIRGNFPSNSGPVLTIQGDDGAGTHSGIFNQFLAITVESNTSTNIPQTLNFGSSSNYIHECEGLMTFAFANWTQSNAGSNFQFKGRVSGDASLVTSAATLTTPSVPTANTNKTNTTRQDQMVYITGGTGVAVSINGVATGLGAGSFYLPDNGVINLGGYSAAPTWVWGGML